MPLVHFEVFQLHLILVAKGDNPYTPRHYYLSRCNRAMQPPEHFEAIAAAVPRRRAALPFVVIYWRPLLSSVVAFGISWRRVSIGPIAVPSSRTMAPCHCGVACQHLLPLLYAPPPPALPPASRWRCLILAARGRPS